MRSVSRSRKVEICSLALLCLTLGLAVLFPLSRGGSIATEIVAANGEWLDLTPGSTVRRELTANGKDVFGITVDAGKVIRLSIDKGDALVSLVLYGPNGTKLVETFSQEFELVEISFPADSPGLYRVELQSREKAARSYELTLQPLRNITPRDRKDGDARQAMGRAEVLRATWTEKALQQASASYDEAASIWASAPDLANAARAMLKAADVHFLLGNVAKAEERYQKGVTWATTAGDRVTQAK